MHALRQLRNDVVVPDLAHCLDHIQRVGIGRHTDTDERGCIAAIDTHRRAITVRAQHHIGDVTQAHNRTVLFTHHQLAELFGIAQIGACGHVDRNHMPLGRAQRGQHVVRLQGLRDIAGGHFQRGHFFRFQPHAHGEVAGAHDFCALHTGHRHQLGLDHAGQIVANLVAIQTVAGKRQIHAGNTLALLQVDHRVFRLRWQLPAHLVDLGADLSERLAGVLVQPDIGLNRAYPRRAGRGHVINALGTGDFALQWRGDKALDQVGIGTEIGGVDVDHGIAHFRIFAHVQFAEGTQAEQQDEQADDQRQHRLLDEDVGKFHAWLLPLPRVGKVWTRGRDRSPAING